MRTVRADRSLHLTDKELSNLEQFPHFLLVFITLQTFLRHHVRYGKDEFKMWLNIYRDIQCSIGNEVTLEQKRTMTVMGWSQFDDAMILTGTGGPVSGRRGGMSARAAAGGTAWGMTVSTPGRGKRDSSKVPVRSVVKDIKEEAEVLLESA